MWDMAVHGDYGAAGPGGDRAQRCADSTRPGAEQPPAAHKEGTRDVWTAQAERDATPTLHEMLLEARTKAEDQRKRFKIKSSTRYGDAPMEAYARLARARSQGEVSAAAGYARRRIAQFKAQLRQEGGDTGCIKAAIAQLQKVALRAGRKKSDLNREQIAKRRRERAAAENREREALRLRQELLRRQAMRTIREGGYLNEAAISDRMATQAEATRAQYALPGGTPGTGAVPPSVVPQVPPLGAEQYVAMAAPVAETPPPTFSAEC